MRSKSAVIPLFSECDSDLTDKFWRKNADGYAERTSQPQGRMSCRPLLAHHEVCIRHFGRKPDWSKHEVCDHINRDKLDNRRENLRLATAKENARNKAKIGCITIHKGTGKCQASLFGKYLGLYATREQSQCAINDAARALKGQP